MPTYNSIGSISSGGNSVSPGTPSGLQATNLVLTCVATKPDTATINTADGWTFLSTVAGGGGSYGNGTGPTRGTVHYAEKSTVWSSVPSQTVSSGNSSAGVAVRYSLETAGNYWDITSATGTFSGGSVSWSAAIGSDPGFQAGDHVLVFCTNQDEAPTWSNQSLTIPGCTVSSLTERSEAIESTTGNDVGGMIATGSITAGTSTGNATFTATTSIASYGTTTIVRIREVAPPASGIVYRGPGAIVQSATTTTTLTVGYPLGIRPGECIVLGIATDSSTPASIPDGWIAGGVSSSSGGNAPAQRIMLKIVDGTETGAVTFNTPAANACGQMHSFANVDLTSPIDTEGSVTASSTATSTHMLPSITTTMPGAALITIACCNAPGGEWSPPSTPAQFTEITETTGVRPQTVMDYLVWSGSGATGVVPMLRTTNSIRGCAGMIALRPASAETNDYEGSIELSGAGTLSGVGFGPPVVLFEEDFNHLSDETPITSSNTNFYSTSGPGTKIADTAFSISGGVSARIATVADGDLSIVEARFTPTDPGCVRFYFRPDHLPSTGGEGETNIAEFRAALNEVRAMMEFSDTGTIGIKNGSMLVATSTTTLLPDQWCRIEWKIDTSASLQTCRLFVGSNLHGTVPDEQISGLYNNGTDLSALWLGSVRKPYAMTAWWDEIVVSDNWVGPVDVQYDLSGSASLSGAGTLSLGVKPSVSRSASLSGAGTLSLGVKPSVSRSASLSGAGTLSLARTVQTSGAVFFSGSGTLSSARYPGFTRALSVSGSGSLSLTRSISVGSIVSLSGAGTLVGSGTALAFASGAANLNGAGTLAGSGKTDVKRVSPLSGSGTLVGSGTALASASGAANLNGVGTLTGSGTADVKRVSPLSGSGTLLGTGTALATASGSANLNGAGSLAVARTVGFTRTVAFSGSGTLVGSGSALAFASGAAALSGAGTLTSTRAPSFTRSLTLSGTGTLAGSGTALAFASGSAGLSGAGTLTLTHTFIISNTLGLSGVGTLSHAGTPGPRQTVALAGTGILSITTSASGSSIAAFNGVGTLSSEVSPNLTGTSIFEGLGTLSTTFTVGLHRTLNLSGSGSLTYSSEVAGSAAVTLSGSGALSSTSMVSASGVLGLSGSGILTVQSAFDITNIGALDGDGSLSTSSKLSASGSLTLSGAGDLILASSTSGAASLYFSGVGDLSTHETIDVLADVELSGLGSLEDTSQISASGATTFFGAGSLSTSTVSGGSSIGELSGTGSLTTSGSVQSSGHLPLSGSGTLELDSTPSGIEHLELSGTGTLTGTGTSTANAAGSASLTGSGTLAGIGDTNINRDTSLSGSGTLSHEAYVSLAGSADLTGVGTLSNEAHSSFSADVALGGSGKLEGEGIAAEISYGEAEFAGSGALGVASADPNIIETLALAGAGTLGSLADYTSIAASGNVNLAGGSELSSTAVPEFEDQLNLSGGSILSYSAESTAGHTFILFAGDGSLYATGVIPPRNITIHSATIHLAHFDANICRAELAGRLHCPTFTGTLRK